MALNALKIFGLCPLKPNQGSDWDHNYNYNHHFFPNNTQSSSTKWIFVKVLGEIPATISGTPIFKEWWYDDDDDDEMNHAWL